MSVELFGCGSRRGFIRGAGRVAAVSALAGQALPYVHGGGDDVIRVALVGCGGRGTGAVGNALGVGGGGLRLVAMADVFDHRLSGSLDALGKRFGGGVDVPRERRFVGFDGYRAAIDSLGAGDVVILATPPAFRWVHFGYAIERGVNVFMEKPVTVDGPTTRRMLGLARRADERGLKVGVGLMVRHCRARRELLERVRGGEIGDVVSLRAYRMHGPTGPVFSDPKPANESELMYQVRRFHSFLWASGGLYSDFYIHQVDECCWMKGEWPVKAHGVGGRHYRGGKVDQNFDSYGVEYTFGDGSHFFMNGRTMVGCHDRFASYVHGSKGMGVVSMSGHSPGRCRTFVGQGMDRSRMIWAYPQPERNPYDLEWEDLIDAIRNGKRYNEAERGAVASLVTSMGRMAAHTGQEVSYEGILNCEHEFAPGVDGLTFDSEAPLRAGEDGRYPIPLPGVSRDREYNEDLPRAI